MTITFLALWAITGTVAFMQGWDSEKSWLDLRNAFLTVVGGPVIWTLLVFVFVMVTLAKVYVIGEKAWKASLEDARKEKS